MRRLFLLLLVVAAGCEQRGGTVAPAPAPPPVVVRFVEGAVAVRESETAEIAVRYDTNGIAGLVTDVIVQHGSAGPADYELATTSLPLDPAGETLVVPMRAMLDDELAEGTETLVLVLRPPAGVASQVGTALDVTITDAGVSPCPGVTAVASPVGSLPGTRYLATTLELDFAPPGEGLHFDWIDPFRHDEDCADEDCRAWWVTRTPYLELNVADWRVETAREAVRHVLDIEWRNTKEVGMRFRSETASCDGEPTIRCTTDGCELDRIGSTIRSPTP